MNKLAKLCALTLLLLGLAHPAVAQDSIHIHDPYARVIMGSGVVFFRIDNRTDHDDVLLSATAPVGMAMLMNDTEDANGVMQMRAVPQGFAVKAGQMRLLTNAGDHVMLTDLTVKPEPGATLALTLTFQHAGSVTLRVPIDNLRRTDPTTGPTPYDGETAKVD
jgi:periplasmic copper chaperone A